MEFVPEGNGLARVLHGFALCTAQPQVRNTLCMVGKHLVAELPEELVAQVVAHHGDLGSIDEQDRIARTMRLGQQLVLPVHQDERWCLGEYLMQPLPTCRQ